MSPHRATGKSSVSSAFLHLGSPQLHQRSGISSLLTSNGRCCQRFSGTALLDRAPADSLSRAEIPIVFSLLKQATAFAGSWHCCQQGCFVLFCLFVWCCFADASLCRFSGRSHSTCVFPDQQSAYTGSPLLGMGAASLGKAETPCFPCSSRLLLFQ